MGQWILSMSYLGSLLRQYRIPRQEADRHCVFRPVVRFSSCPVTSCSTSRRRALGLYIQSDAGVGLDDTLEYVASYVVDMLMLLRDLEAGC